MNLSDFQTVCGIHRKSSGEKKDGLCGFFDGIGNSISLNKTLHST